MKKFLSRGVLSGIVLSTALLATACPPPTPPAAVTRTFKASQVTINNEQDETCFLGICSDEDLGSAEDEVYVLNVNFRVKLGVAGSAQAWVSGDRGSYQGGMDAGETAALSDGAGGLATFTGVKPLDIIDLLDANNKLEIIGTWSWVTERDFVAVGNGASADLAAGLLEDALNETIAAGAVPSDLSFLVDLILDNIGNALLGIGNNLVGAFFGDDILGSGMYIGIGAKGELANIVNSSLSGFVFPTLPIPVVSSPPDITKGGIYTTSGVKSFNGQTFSGEDGTWTLNFTGA